MSFLYITLCINKFTDFGFVLHRCEIQNIDIFTRDMWISSIYNSIYLLYSTQQKPCQFHKNTSLSGKGNNMLVKIRLRYF